MVKTKLIITIDLKWRRDIELVNNLVNLIGQCDRDIQERMAAHLAQCDQDYGRRVAEGLGLSTKAAAR